MHPDDLIQRLKDGKVYVPTHAERALKHYFSRGNLTALRELALRLKRPVPAGPGVKPGGSGPIPPPEEAMRILQQAGR